MNTFPKDDAPQSSCEAPSGGEERTERQRAEEHQKVLFDIAEIIRRAENDEGLLYGISQAVGEYFQVRRCLFNEIDLERDRETVHRDYCRGVESVAGVHRISDYSSVTSGEMQAGHTVVNRDSQIDPRTANYYERTYAPAGERAYVAVPLLRDHRWVTSLWVSDAQPRNWSEAEIGLLEAIAERAWLAVEKLRSEKALRVSERYLEQQSRIFDATLSSITDFVYTFDREGRFIYVNHALLDLWGLKLEDAAGKNFYDLNYPEDLAARLQRQIQQVFDTGQGLKDETPYTSPTGAGGYYEYIFNPVIAADGTVEIVAGSTRDITERKQAEEKIKQLSERNRDILESITDGFFALDRDWSFTYVNPQAELILDRMPGDLVGNVIWDVYPGLAGSEFETAYHRVANEGVGATFTSYYPDHDRWYEVNAYPAPSGITVYFRNVTERVQAEEVLRESEERFRMMADNISQFAWMADAQGSIFWYNQRWYDYTGTTLKEMQGWGWQTVHHPEELERVVRHFKHSIETGATWEDTFPLRGRDGEYRWFLSRASPIRDEGGRIVRWFGTNTDIEELRQARKSAEEANRLKDEFLATVSHELRTPLTSILGWSAMLRRNEFDDTTRARALETIERNAHAQQQIIEDLLEVSRIITGKLRIETEAVELVHVIEAALDVVRPAAAAKNIHLRATIDPMVAPIAGDASRLQQIVWNLLTNAVKFTPPAGLVEVRVASVGSHAEIIVSDNGDGIAADFLPYVFDRFRQADGTTKRAHGGLGLGLAIVRHLVEAHGGTVHVASRGTGQGSTFTIKLPLLLVAQGSDNGAQSASPSSAPKAEQPTASSRALEGVSVLLVDDDDDSRHLLGMLLANYGADVAEAETAAAALALFQQRKPDVLISDIGMPEADGYDLIRRVRELERGNDVQTPAAALTAYASEDDRARAIAAGYGLHLPKPVEPAAVIAAIAKLAGKAPAV